MVMMTLPIRILRLLATCLLAGALLAQPFPSETGGRLLFSVLGPDQGFPSGIIMSIAQDSDGFLWFGSENGLLRYEGGQTRHFTPKDGLPSGTIQALLPAQGGGLWVSTNHGLVRFKDGVFEPAQLGSGPPRQGSFRLAQDGQGRLWAANQLGVWVQKAGLTFEQLPFKPEGGINLLTFGRASATVYLGWPGGLVAFSADGSRRVWTSADGLPPGGPHLLAEDGSGRLWAGTSRTLVMKEKEGTRFLDRSAQLDRSLSPNASAYVDRDGTVWLPTQDGAIHLVGERFEPLDREQGLPFRWVRMFFRDREGTLWVAGPSVARMLGGNRVWNYALSKKDTGEIVWFILRGRDGRLLVGTDDGAAVLENGHLARIPGTEGRRIKSMAEDAAGTLWLTSTIGPTLWVRAGKARAETAPLGELGASINSVARDSKGRIWLGHALQGVLRWDAPSGRLVQEVGPAFVSQPLLGAFDLSEDRQGRIWAATTFGLLVRDLEGRWSRFAMEAGLRSQSLHGVALLPDGSAWIYYQEPSGMTRVRVEGGRLIVLEHHTQKEGLPSEAVYAMQAGSRGQIWATSDQGLIRLQPPLHIGRQDGMANEDCALHALLVEGDRVWVGTAGGLVRVEPGVDPAQESPPQVHLLQVALGSRLLEPPYGRLDPVPHRDATAEFRFTAPEYQNEHGLRYQVRLVGLEEAWRDPGAKVSRWSVLPGGSYRFEVRAARGSGPFGVVAGLDFAVRPPWWQTWWASALAGLGGVGAVLMFIRFRLASLARSKALLELQVAQRTEELRARNAELSSALGKVRQLSGLLPICAHCKKIRDDRGYWNQLEEYITEHSEAGFSHGICPDCVPLMYPELAAQRRNSQAGSA
jgi:ligand-binding sensor domain-containing protein